MTMTASSIHLLPRRIDRERGNKAALAIAGFSEVTINQSNPFMGLKNRIFVYAEFGGMMRSNACAGRSYHTDV
jgi:hypothetical protein